MKPKQGMTLLGSQVSHIPKKRKASVSKTTINRHADGEELRGKLGDVWDIQSCSKCDTLDTEGLQNLSPKKQIHETF